MKAARIHEYGQPLVLEEVPIPDIQSDEVLVNVKACGMCRSDVLLVDSFFQNYGDIKPPVTPGYEITGVIDKIGATVSKAAGLVEGDHVVVAAGWGDGKCRHARNPDKLGVAEGYGADHVINIKDKSSSEIAQELSKATGQSALDAVADCAGATEMMQLAFSLLAIGGHYVDVGFVGDRIDIPLFPRVSREQTFHGSFWGNNTDLTEVMALAAQDKIRHTIKVIKFEQINEYLDLLRAGDIVGRAVVKY